MGTAHQANAHKEQAAMLQLIADGMRSPNAERLSPAQLEHVAGLLDRIAVDLLVPTTNEEDGDLALPAGEAAWRTSLHG
jgi:hypothetical protein